jgi:acyl-CoA thioesterase-2
MALLGTSMRPHGVGFMTPGMQTASLDHALWLHEPFRADEWLLYTMDSPWAGHARGFNRGRVFTRDGRLVASSAQEGLIRRRE